MNFKYVASFYPYYRKILAKFWEKILSNCYISKLNTIYLFLESYEMHFFSTFTIRLVFQISVLFIINSLVPIPDGFWDQTLVNIPFRISPKRPHKVSLNRLCMTNFFTCPLPITNYVISAQWGGITSQFSLFRRVKQSITAVTIKCMYRLYNDHNEHTVFYGLRITQFESIFAKILPRFACNIGKMKLKIWNSIMLSRSQSAEISDQKNFRVIGGQVKLFETIFRIFISPKHFLESAVNAT